MSTSKYSHVYIKSPTMDYKKNSVWLFAILIERLLSRFMVGLVETLIAGLVETLSNLHFLYYQSKIRFHYFLKIDYQNIIRLSINPCKNFVITPLVCVSLT